jgi:hypothetical protein
MEPRARMGAQVTGCVFRLGSVCSAYRWSYVQGICSGVYGVVHVYPSCVRFPRAWRWKPQRPVGLPPLHIFATVPLILFRCRSELDGYHLSQLLFDTVNHVTIRQGDWVVSGLSRGTGNLCAHALYSCIVQNPCPLYMGCLCLSS